MSGETVLIIDDSIAIASLLANEILPHAGYRTAVTLSGREGLAVARRTQPDLILCDLEMPDMNGLEVLRSLRGEGYSIPSVMMTAFGSEAIAAQALRIGVKDYIIKPFTTEEILAAVDNALSESRLRLELDEVTRSLKDHQQTLTILRALGQAVSSGLGPEALLGRIVLAAVYSQGAQGGFLAEFDHSGYLVIRAAVHYPQWEGKRIRVTSDSPLGRALQTHRVTHASDHGGHWYYVPLIRKDVKVGLLAVFSRKEKSVGDIEAICSILAGYSVCVIENWNLSGRPTAGQKDVTGQ
jgi:two-component system, NtrC family, sensor kinase